MAGREPGLLAGIPVGHKDLLMTKGVRSSSGSMAYKDFVPDEDDIVVERMRAAGAVMLGKTNVAEFGYSATGQQPGLRNHPQSVEQSAQLRRFERRDKWPADLARPA